MDKLLQAHIKVSIDILTDLVNSLSYDQLQELRSKLKDIEAMIEGKQYRLFKEKVEV